MRQTTTAALLLIAASTAHAQVDLGGVFRSLSGSLRGKEAQQPAQQQGVTPVMGLRGIDEVDAPSNAPASGDYVMIDGWAATRAAAERAAAGKKLKARDVALRAEASTEPKTGEAQ